MSLLLPQEVVKKYPDTNSNLKKYPEWSPCRALAGGMEPLLSACRRNGAPAALPSACRRNRALAERLPEEWSACRRNRAGGSTLAR